MKARHAASTLLVALSVVLVQPVLVPLERAAFDLRLRLRVDGGWPADLVLVPIDDAAMRIEGRWPWRRDRIAELLHRLRAHGARTVLLDLLFGVPSETAPDVSLAGAVADSVLAIGIARDGGLAPNPDTLRRAAVDAPGWSIAFPPENLIVPIPPVANAAAGLGHIATFPADDGRMRSFTPLLAVAGRPGSIPDLSLRTLLRHRSWDPASVRLEDGELRFGPGRRLRLHGGQAYFDFVPGGPRAPALSAAELLSRPPDGTLRDRLGGRLAIVYVDSAYTADRFASPISSGTPGGLLNAYAVRTLDGGRTPRTVPVFPAVIVLALGVAAAAGRIAARPVTEVILATALSLVLVVSAGAALVPLADLFLPVAAPAALVLGDGALLAAFAARRAEGERRTLRALLANAKRELSSTETLPIPAAALRADMTVRAAVEPETTRRLDPSGVAPEPEVGIELLVGGQRLVRPVMVGRYRVTRRLGRGGMGALFLAEDTSLERKVALKILESSEPNAYARFRREALAIARIAHPNVVQVHEIGSDATVPYIVMEFVQGGSLDDLLKGAASPRPLPWSRMSRIVAGVARGLGAAHERGIVHRDVKPANVLLVDAGGEAVKVADFGIAVLSDADRITAAGIAIGTIGYLSPEQAQGMPVHPQSDVYSLAVTWYKLLTGESAFRGTPTEVLRRAMTEPLPDPRERVPEIPEPVVALLRRMSAIDPGNRPGNGTLAAEEIDAVLESLGEGRP